MSAASMVSGSASLSAHARHARWLAWLCGEGPHRLVASLATERGLAGPDASWCRTYARFMPDPNVVARLEFELPGAPRLRLDALEHARLASDSARVRRRTAAGVVEIGLAESDERLPGLHALLAGPDRAEVLRHRPGKRCTVRVQAAEGVRFAKCFPDDRGAQVHAMHVALEAAAQRGELDFAVAPALGWDGARRCLWQGVVPGAPLLGRIASAEGSALARAMGRALASLARIDLGPMRVPAVDDQRRRTRHALETLVSLVPVLREDARRIAETLDAAHAAHAAHGARRAVTLHGSPHVHQWLADGDRLGLVDFDRAAYGDPELDLATFVVEMEYEDPAQIAIDAVNAAFVAGFEERFGPIDRDRLAVYRLHKVVAKALRAARSLRVDGDVRATRHLAHALALTPEIGTPTC